MGRTSLALSREVGRTLVKGSARLRLPPQTLAEAAIWAFTQLTRRTQVDLVRAYLEVDHARRAIEERPEHQVYPTV